MSEPTVPTEVRPGTDNGSTSRSERPMHRGVGKPVLRESAGSAQRSTSEASAVSADDAAKVEDVRAALGNVPAAPYRPDASLLPNGHGNGHTEGVDPTPSTGGGGTGEPPEGGRPIPGAQPHEEPSGNGHHDLLPAPVQGATEAGTSERPGEQVTTPEEKQRLKTADELYNDLPEEWRDKVKAAGGEEAVKKLLDLSLNKDELTPEQNQQRTAALTELKKMIDENPELADETRLAFQRMGLNMDELLEKHDEEEATTAEERAALEAEGQGMMQKLKSLFGRKKDKESEEEAKKTIDEISNSGFIERIRKKHKVLYVLLITTMITVALYFGLVGSVSSAIAGKR